MRGWVPPQLTLTPWPGPFGANRRVVETTLRSSRRHQQCGRVANRCSGRITLTLGAAAVTCPIPIQPSLPRNHIPGPTGRMTPICERLGARVVPFLPDATSSAAAHFLSTRFSSDPWPLSFQQSNVSSSSRDLDDRSLLASCLQLAPVAWCVVCPHLHCGRAMMLRLPLHRY